MYSDRGNSLSDQNVLDYELANNIFLQAMHSSSQTPVSPCESAPPKLDRMHLLKAYENVLRGEGILPVSDSKIYNLVFDVFSRGKDDHHQLVEFSDEPSPWFMRSLKEHKDSS